MSPECTICCATQQSASLQYASRWFNRPDSHFQVLYRRSMPLKLHSEQASLHDKDDMPPSHEALDRCLAACGEPALRCHPPAINRKPEGGLRLRIMPGVASPAEASPASSVPPPHVGKYRLAAKLEQITHGPQTSGLKSKASGGLLLGSRDMHCPLESNNQNCM